LTLPACPEHGDNDPDPYVSLVSTQNTARRRKLLVDRHSTTNWPHHVIVDDPPGGEAMGFVPHIWPRKRCEGSETWSEWQDLNLRPLIPNEVFRQVLSVVSYLELTKQSQ
jgi:hypothetical protein